MSLRQLRQAPKQLRQRLLLAISRDSLPWKKYVHAQKVRTRWTCLTWSLIRELNQTNGGTPLVYLSLYLATDPSYKSVWHLSWCFFSTSCLSVKLACFSTNSGLIVVWGKRTKEGRRRVSTPVGCPSSSCVVRATWEVLQTLLAVTTFNRWTLRLITGKTQQDEFPAKMAPNKTITKRETKTEERTC